MIIDKDNTVVAGHARVMAAKEIKLKSVPTILVEHLSESEKRAYILADNKKKEVKKSSSICLPNKPPTLPVLHQASLCTPPRSNQTTGVWLPKNLPIQA